MAAASMEFAAALRAIAEALLIGLLVGAQREAAQDERHPGVRDFILIGLTGGVCGLLQNSLLTVAALAGIATLLGIFHLKTQERTGITTEMAAVATFCLGVLTATPGFAPGAPLAIGTAIVVVAFLEAKRSLHKLVRETITEREFNDTLQFLAMIFVIYPVLPAGDFGPYHFFTPRRVWLFVILVSSISYVGYFLQRFLGARKGLTFLSVLGGLASTTAATAAFARSSADEPEKLTLYWQAAAVANAIQFPRVLAILYVVNPNLAWVVLPPLAAMTAVGLLLGYLISRKAPAETGYRAVTLGNPFRLAPALKFGLMFTAILFATKAAAGEIGIRAVYWTSALGGSLDADSVAVSLADLMAGAGITPGAAEAGLLLALLANAVLKSAIAAYAGRAAFGWRVAATFLVMFGAGCVAWLATSPLGL